ncbi:MAG: hypothetical protein A2Y40_03005 [Candidatus Margulisbacteria bacterium GWF2_35_9]|nr:MAG: hypothetical protein A2Y40_03005 [Candidatus Margulisbacteria bacterium GWF2_35_9]
MRNVRLEQKGKARLIYIEGDIEFDDADKLEEKFLQILKSEQSNIIVELSDCVYIDSHGLACLFNGHKTYKEKNRRFLLCNLHESLKEIFSMTTIGKYLSIFDTLEQALVVAG